MICFQEQDHVLEKNYIFAEKGTAMSHKFCVAINNGQCQNHRWKARVGGDGTSTCSPASVAAVASGSEAVCPQAQVAVPAAHPCRDTTSKCTGDPPLTP